MSHFRSVAKTMFALVAAGSVLALSACAPEPEVTPTPTATAAPETPVPDAYDGPLVFIGDELDWFALTPDEILDAVPDTAGVSELTPTLIQVSDGGGPEPVPSICMAIIAEASLGSVGARTMTWSSALPDERGGQMQILQFADEAQAQTRMDEYIAAADQCAEFTYSGPSSFDSAVIDDPNGVRAVAGSLLLGNDPSPDWQMYYGFASIGNVIVELWHPYTGDSTLDATALATLLRDRADAARVMLVDKHTLNPPAPPEEAPAADPTAAWSTWEIGYDGIGPIRVGEQIDVAATSVPGAQVVEPQWEGGPWEIISSDGSGALSVTPPEEGTVVASITAGDLVLYGEPPVDGAPLPTAKGVGVGDRAAEAVAAFPGGTAVHVVSAGIYSYEVTTREGRVLTFSTDREIADAEATIIGITVEDATLRRHFTFG